MLEQPASPQKFFICNSTGSVYWREGNEIAFAPLSNDGTFETGVDASGLVEPDLDEPVTCKGELYSWPRFYKMLQRKLPVAETAPF